MANKNDLIALLDHEKYMSGEMLSKLLGISRTAIWKHINILKKKGVNVYSVKGKGYKLAEPVYLLDEKEILSTLKSKSVNINSLIIIDSLPSTNTFLSQNAHKYPNNTVCLAEQQTQGRGRNGRQWYSPYASNIYLSLLWKTDLPLNELSTSSICVGLALLSALEKLGILGAKIKWPNDIYYDDKKLAGILIDVKSEINGTHNVVIGIGVNTKMPVNEYVPIDQEWIDLQQINADIPERNMIVAVIIDELIGHLHEFADNGLKGFLDTWRRYDYLYGSSVSIMQNSGELVGMAEGIDENGALLVRTVDGKVSVYAGEVKCRKI